MFGPATELLSEFRTTDDGGTGEIGGAARRYDRGTNYRPDLDGSHPFGTPEDFAGLTPVPSVQPPEPICAVEAEPQLTVLMGAALQYADVPPDWGTTLLSLDAIDGRLLLGVGGDLWDGAAVTAFTPGVPPAYTLSGTGGDLWDGAAVTAYDDHMYLLSGTGGDLWDGAAVTESDTDVFEPGSIVAFGGSGTPAGWLDCDGSAVSRTTYSDLFSAIGTTWGPGDGSTTFNVPDFQGRAPIGSGTGSGLSPRAVGDAGGEEDHQLTKPEMAVHNHDLGGNTANFIGDGAAANVYMNSVPTAGQVYGATDNEGGDFPHNNMQPFGVVHFLIKT